MAKILELSSVATITKCTSIHGNEQSVNNDSTPTRTALDEFSEAYGFRLSPRLDETQRYLALELLYRYKSVFARTFTEIRQCKGEPLKLDLHTNRKMFKRQYRLSKADKEKVARQIKEMEDADVIERSSSAFYDSPTYLVAKKWQ